MVNESKLSHKLFVHSVGKVCFGAIRRSGLGDRTRDVFNQCFAWYSQRLGFSYTVWYTKAS